MGSSRKKQDKTTTKAINGREGHRIPIQLLVDYRSGGNYLFDFCKDLGTGGVFIQTDKPLDQGSNVSLTFTIPDSKETLETSGHVIWVQFPNPSDASVTPGMGVQFDEFTSEQRKVMEDFVSRYNAKADTNGSKSAS
jgi:type IV pilus assembly protein PilZ